MLVSIIMPVYNEAKNITCQLNQLSQQFASPLAENEIEIIVVDGGSSDNTAALVRASGNQLVMSSPGRAIQMNMGADRARGRYLLFLHADTQLPDTTFPFVERQAKWGFFHVKLSGSHRFFRVIEAFINWRTNLTFSAGGDQAIFTNKQFFFDQGGFKVIPLMEDIELSNRLKKINKPYIIKQAVTTSSRRWQDQGMVKTVVLMWVLRFGYYCGVAPTKLKEFYANHQ